MKDHEIAILVQELVICANKYHYTQQLRDRISEIVQNALSPTLAALKEAQEQEPLMWETSSELMDILKNPIFARPVPAAPATHVLGADDQLATLMRFYQVSDIPSLALAQAEHVERLQAKLPAMRDDTPRNPRGA